MVIGMSDGDFAAWLRRRREALMITQEVLADTAGLSVRTIRYLETGRSRPRAYTRDAIGTALERLAARAAELVPNGMPPPAQLPLDQAAFVGRMPVLDDLDKIATSAQVVAGLALINGSPGIGKTAVAVHWAHRARAMFPDGQLFADLNGFSPVTGLADPDEILQGFLEALGVDVEQIPRRMADRIGLYRTMLAYRRVLILLDNAAEAGQIRPLIPASAGSMAVVTSRNQLADLVTIDGARPVPVGPCTPVEGRALLAARLGSARLERDGEATEEIVRLCAGMPLALSMVAARAAAHPQFALAGLVADLKSTAGANLTADVRSAMSWSAGALSGQAIRAFRILGLHPRPEITAEVIAAVDDRGLEAARASLDELADANLLSERRPARFAMHDVVHGYAGDVARESLDPPERDRIRRRLHQHYAAIATAAVHIICPQHELTGEANAERAAAPPKFQDAENAVAVLRAEHDVLFDIIRDAARHDEPETLWQLASSLFIFYDRLGRWRALTSLAQDATRAADRLDDPRRLEAIRLAAIADARNGDKQTALQRLDAAVRLAEDAGNAVATAAFHFDLGAIFDSEDRHTESGHHFGQARDAYRRAGDVPGEASALNAFGWAQLHLGRPALALDNCRRALVLHGLVGNPQGEASTLDTCGLALHHIGDGPQAIDAYQAALELMPAVGDRHLESAILEHLGDAWESSGNLVHARTTRERALMILDDISPAKARDLRSRLRRTAAE
jgi:tetratricopeptide (TPR) repeat protein/transcriptional regulator with XRE-family HTH domain